MYMDDIIISTSQPLAVAKLAFATLKKKAERSNLSLNPDKTSGPGESVTAFNIELASKIFLLTEERLEASKVAYVESDNIFAQEGIRGYVNSVSAIQGGSL